MKPQVETWTRRTSKQIADCRVFKVREDFCARASDAKEATFFVIECPDWVNVIALTAADETVLIEQYRQGSEEITLEIPGGMVDAGENLETAAKRELLEETGYTSDKFVYLGKSRPNPAIQNNWIHHYAAFECVKTGETSFDEHESVATRVVPNSEVGDLIKSGAITHALAVAGFYYLHLHEKM